MFYNNYGAARILLPVYCLILITDTRLKRVADVRSPEAVELSIGQAY
jgi:hypothetical protein